MTNRLMQVQYLETEDGITFSGKYKSKGPYMKDSFLIICQTEHLRMAKDKSLTITDIRTYLYILSTIAKNNKIKNKQKEIAKELETTPTLISASIKKLTERGYLVKEREKTISYYLNPNLGYKGDHSEFLAKEGSKVVFKSAPCELSHVG